jgi:hypothetical protein
MSVHEEEDEVSFVLVTSDEKMYFMDFLPIWIDRENN